MKHPKPIIVEKDGKAVDIFISIQDLARVHGMNPATAKRRIRLKTEVKGMLFRLLTEEETGMLRAAAIETVNKNKEEKPDPEPNEEPDIPHQRKEWNGCHPDDMELDHAKYSIVPYELQDNCICITVCPYRDSPKPMVGSALCMQCHSFHGRNRRERQVACSAVNGKTWSKKRKE